MTAATLTRPHRLVTRRRIPVTAASLDRLGFGYSRDPEPDTNTAVPDGVELIFMTGRTPRGAQ